MKLSTAYRKAAQLIARGKHHFACLAIREARGFVTDFEDRFRPTRLPKNAASKGWYGDTEQASQDARVLALCFMAAIMEDEGK